MADELNDGTGPSEGERAAFAAVTRRLKAFPPRIGRYRIVGRLGEGGMGSVYRGFDPELERPVAVKLLHSHFGLSDGARSRLAREAQALAAVSHPNVVGVYEVGIDDGKPFIAMEYVDAQDLRAWVRAEDPSWREVIPVYLQAGAGLSAAHARGIVHRDFKPTNVLRGTDGRVRVVDFGLARVALQDGEELPTERNKVLLPKDTGSFSGPLAGGGSITRTGALVGTPAYMAPEQHFGGTATPRSDQFSFCVALWEGLYGSRPFTVNTSEAFLRAIRAGSPVPMDSPKGLPRRILPILRRGLSLEPERRWKSLAHLCTQLSRALANERRPRTRALVAGTTLLVGLGGYSLVSADSEGPAACPSAEDADALVWNSSRRASLAAKFDGFDQAAEWTRFEGFVDAYLVRWRGAFESACETGLEQPQQLSCVEQRLTEVDELLTVVEERDADVIASAVEGASALSSVESCATADSRPQTLDPEVKAEVDATRSQITRARALKLAGKFDEAGNVAAAAVTVAHRLENDPLLAEARLAQGRIVSDHPEGDVDEAIAAFEEAYALSLDGGDDTTAMNAAISLVAELTNEKAEYRAALRWWRHAEAASERAEVGIPPRGFVLVGTLYKRLGRDEDAEASFRSAIARVEQSAPETPKQRLDHQTLLGLAHLMLGDRTRAAEVLSEAVELAEEFYGAKSLVYAGVSKRLADAYLEDLRFKDAEQYLRAVVTVYEERYPAPHYKNAEAQLMLGTALTPQGRIEEGLLFIQAGEAQTSELYPGSHDRAVYGRVLLADALFHARRLEESATLLDRIIADVEAEFGPKHTNLAEVIHRRGRVEGFRDQAELAKSYFERALDIYRGTHSKPPGYYECLGSLAMAQTVTGDFESAAVNADELRAMLIERFGADHQVTLDATSQLLRTYREAGRAAEFVDEAELAVKTMRDNDVDALHVATAEFELARTLVAAGQDGHRAVALARAARAVFQADERADTADIEKLDAFIAKYR